MEATMETPLVTGLPDACAEAFVYAMSLRRAEDPGDLASIHESILAILRRMDHAAARIRTPQELVEHARFALVAFFDEILMNRPWSGQSEWQNSPLQLAMFNTLAAGEGFFERAELILTSRDPEAKQALEVFATCLSLEFRGKYGASMNHEELRLLRSRIHDCLRRDQFIDSRTLSPSLESHSTASQLRRQLPTWFWLLGAALISVVVALILAGISSSNWAEFLGRIQNLPI